MKIEGKVGMVIGGVSGIGRCIVDMLLEKGAKLLVADIQDEAGRNVVKATKEKYGEGRIVYEHCDITNEEQIESLFVCTLKEYGSQVDIVITTAGIIDENNWQRCLDVNVGGSIRLLNAALRHMGKDKGHNGGTLILTSSISGIQPEFWGPVYSASKHAVIALARSWACDENYLVHGVRINMVCPGGVDTPFLSQVSNGLHAQWHRDRHEDMRNRSVMFKPADIAPGFIQLIEDDTANGKALRLTFDLGTHYVDFPQGVYA